MRLHAAAVSQDRVGSVIETGALRALGLFPGACARVPADPLLSRYFRAVPISLGWLRPYRNEPAGIKQGPTAGLASERRLLAQIPAAEGQHRPRFGSWSGCADGGQRCQPVYRLSKQFTLIWQSVRFLVGNLHLDLDVGGLASFAQLPAEFQV
jgi:hypothetical protein